MHYLVTGGLGFIGLHLCEYLLAANHRVTILDDLSSGKPENLPPHARFVQGDITTPGIFDTLIDDLDGCFHLAAIASVPMSEKQWLRTHNVNLGGTVALFDAIARCDKKIPVVYASSAAVYGECLDLPLSEISRCQPLSSYGCDKYGCELQAKIASHVHAIPTIGLRFFNVYGQRQDPHSPYSGVISIFSDSMKKNAPVTIYGDGKQTRDFIYVHDVIQGLMSSMKKLENKHIKCGVFNLSTGVQTSIIALASMIAHITDSQSSITYNATQAGDIRHSVGNTTCSQEQLGFRAEFLLIDGLTQTLEAL
jgi:UDP-glucose 4-epimerase